MHERRITHIANKGLTRFFVAGFGIKINEAVDLCYRSQPFTSETNRLEFLFGLYNKYTNPLIAANEKRIKKIEKVKKKFLKLNKK